MRKQWRCFYCDEVFTTRKDAAIHFGTDESCTAACLLAHEKHLVMHIRDLEQDMEISRREDGNIMRSIMTLESEHRAALIREEQRGYDKGVRDMKAQGHCPDPKAHT